MAKGMNKGNKEAKKPKKAKVEVKVVPSSAPLNAIRESQDRTAGKKK